MRGGHNKHTIGVRAHVDFGSTAACPSGSATAACLSHWVTVMEAGQSDVPPTIINAPERSIDAAAAIERLLAQADGEMDGWLDGWDSCFLSVALSAFDWCMNKEFFRP